MTRLDPGHSIRLDDAELDAVTDILGRAIEPHSCAEGTSWRPAYTAWEKCAVARGTLDAEDRD